MRRMIALIAVLGGLTAGVGCHCCDHIGGKFDCGYDPSNYPIAAPSQPYPSYPVPGVTPVPDPIPKSKDGTGTDTKPKDGKGTDSKPKDGM